MSKELSRALLDTEHVTIVIDGQTYTASVSGVSVSKLFNAEIINVTITDTTKEVP